MTWTHIQDSPQAVTASGTSIAPTFPVGTTAGNLLVAVLSASAAGTWTLPAGWVQGPDVTNGGNHSAIWYYIGNPGAVTSVTCTYSVTSNLKGAVSEFHTDVSGTVVANALGTATAGTVASCTASTSSPAAAGDLAVCCFTEHFSTSTAITWTNPSGFTAIAADTASAGNHEYGAYDLSAAGGTLAVTATSSVASDVSTGWTGTVLTFTAQAGAAPAVAWTQVQKSAAEGVTNSGSTLALSLPAASTGTSSRPHVVVACLLASNGSWTLPAGWVMGPDIINGTSIRASVAYYVDTTGGVGTSTTFTNSLTTPNMKGWMAEYDPGVSGVSVTLNAQGTGVAGAVSSCAVTTGTTAAANDLGVCCFAEHFSSGTAITWTTPSGWTLIGSDGASSGGNHLFAGHDLSLAAGSLSVTGKSSVASTLANGWAGAVATFTAAAPMAAGTPGLTGAFLNASKYGTGTTMAQAISFWEANSGRFLSARRVYYGTSGFPSAITTDLQADANAGRKVCLSFRPAFNPPSSSDQVALSTFLSSCKNAGLSADVALWIEPYFEGLTASQYITGVQFYAATIRQYYPLVFVTSAGSVNSHNENSYWPGDAYIDKVATDYYNTAYLAGIRLGQGGTTDPAYHADNASPAKPFGIWEFNGSLDATQGQTQAQITEFFGYIQSYMAGRLAAGKNNADILLFNSDTNLSQETPIVTPDGGTSPYSSTPEFRNALYDKIYDATAGTTQPLTVTTISLPAGTVGVAYDVFVQAAGGTPPYTWSLTSGALPAGLSLSAAGEITGTPTTAGSSSPVIMVTDSATPAATASQSYTLTVINSLAITTTTLPGATQNSAYTTTLTATGGTSPYTWSLASGTLPPGLSLDAPSGTISGTPTTTGTVPFTAEVTDAAAVTATTAMWITVDPPGGPVTAPGTPVAANTGFPQVVIEAGMPSAAPVVPAGTFILDDPVSGKLGTGKLADSTAWTDITSALRSGTISRPSSRQQGPLLTYQAGTGSAVLDNSDGRFDPDNLTGPYVAGGVSHVAAMVPIRARVTFGNVDYPLFYGFADAWQETAVDYDEGYSEVTVTATDGFKILQGVTIPASGAAGTSEDSGARVTRILNAAAWFTDHRRVATGDSTLQATTFGDTALNLLQLAADSEAGELYVDGAGNLVFRNRQAILLDTRSTVPQAVFGDLPGTVHTAGTELAYAFLGRANDDTQLANDVQITRVGGTAQRAQDAASVRKNLFPRSYSRTDIILETDLDALAFAQWILTVSLSPEDRFDSLTIDPRADPANLFPQVLGREIGDRIQVWRRPQNSGQVITRDCFIRGITHNIDAVAGTWQTVWDLQDASRYGGFLILDDPVNGKLGTGKLAF